MKYRAVVIGASTGGMKAIRMLLAALPAKFRLPILIVQHLSPHSDDYLVKHLNENSKLTVKEADEKEAVRGGFVYLAPPNYHLLVEKDMTLSLSVESRVNYSRPSVDVLFESAADAFGSSLIGIILTGANKDGSNGLKYIKSKGGLAIVQDPKDAEANLMPASAIEAAEVDYILSIENISSKLIELVGEKND